MEIDQEYLYSLFTFYQNFYEINKPKLTQLQQENKSLTSQISECGFKYDKLDEECKKLQSELKKKKEIIENQKKSIDQNHVLTINKMNFNKINAQLDEYKIKYEKLEEGYKKQRSALKGKDEVIKNQQSLINQGYNKIENNSVHVVNNKNFKDSTTVLLKTEEAKTTKWKQKYNELYQINKNLMKSLEEMETVEEENENLKENLKIYQTNSQIFKNKFNREHKSRNHLNDTSESDDYRLTPSRNDTSKSKTRSRKTPDDSKNEVFRKRKKKEK